MNFRIQRREGVVLKHGPGPAEAAMLRWCDGVGMVRLLAEEPDLLILEELAPGTPLAELEDERALRLAAGVMRTFWRPPPPEGFPACTTGPEGSPG